MEKVCRCPICGQGEVVKEFIPSSLQDEPYFYKLPSKMYCKKCNVNFSTISLSKNKNVIKYQLEE